MQIQLNSFKLLNAIYKQLLFNFNSSSSAVLLLLMSAINLVSHLI